MSGALGSCHSAPKNMHEASLIPSHILAISLKSLEEVFSSRASSLGNRSPMIWHGAEDAEFRIQIFTQTHYACDIPASVAVIRRRPYGHDVLVFEVVFVAFLHELMCSSDELKAIDVIELFHHLCQRLNPKIL